MPNIETNDLNSLAKLKALPENMGVCVCVEVCVLVGVYVCSGQTTNGKSKRFGDLRFFLLLAAERGVKEKREWER